MSLNTMLIFFSPLPDQLDTEFTHLNSHMHVKTRVKTITPKPVVLELSDKGCVQDAFIVVINLSSLLSC